MLTPDDFRKWMDRYAQASEAGDPQTAAGLFALDAEYRETPFDEPIRGRDAIYRYWREAAPQFTAVRFAYEILAVTGNLGIAHWQTQFTSVRTGRQAALDGVFLVEFDERGQCSRFREWWHRRDQDAGASTA